MVQDISMQRIAHLFDLALENAVEHPNLSDRYIQMAVRIAQRTRVRIPRSYKRFLCKSCMAFIYPGTTARVRINQRRSPHLTVTCLRCKAIRRYSIHRK